MYKNKVVNLVLSVCFSILAVFPFAWGSFSAISNFTNYQTFKWGALSLILVILVAFYGLMHVADKLKVKNWVLISALVLITISLRLLAQNVLDTHPVTDFED
ncbi:MAG: hypothetical protein ACK2TV_15980, partial [Anaerolineales bacterium]